MNKKEQYKRLIMFLASALIVALETAVFAYVWYFHYADEAIIGKTFWKKGNFVVIAQYALMIYLFYRIYGGFKVGYLRVFEVLFADSFRTLRKYDYLSSVVSDWTMEVYNQYSSTDIYDDFRSGDCDFVGNIHEDNLREDLSAT